MFQGKSIYLFPFDASLMHPPTLTSHENNKHKRAFVHCNHTIQPYLFSITLTILNVTNFSKEEAALLLFGQCGLVDLSLELVATFGRLQNHAGICAKQLDHC